MVQYVQLIRTKRTDIYALFIIEFLKFIGCIYTEYVYHDSKPVEDEPCRTQDVNIFLDIEREKIKHVFEESGNISSTKTDGLDIYLEFSFPKSERHNYIPFDRKVAGDMLDQIILEIWGNEKFREELLLLKEIYLSSDCFFFLYSEGNIKFVEDYYPVSGKENKAVAVRREAYTKSYDHFVDCYNQLMKEKKNGDIISPYFEYALLLIKYKLNEMVILLDARNLFLLDNLLEQVKEMRTNHEDFLRLEYLAGSMCKRGRKYWVEAETCYKRAVSKFKKGKEMEAKWISFIYYQLGRFYEHKLNNQEQAYSVYEKAARHKTYYRPWFKLLKRAEKQHDADKVKEYANQLIGQLLNGYMISSVMPKERIYAYKCLNVLGGLYFEQKEYDLAKRCYEQAKEVSQGGSDFYDTFCQGENKCFLEIFNSCMPVKPILSQLVICYSKLNQMADVERCWKERKNME